MGGHKQGGPGKSYRKGITLIQAVETFGDEAQAEAWFIKQRWPNRMACPNCGSVNVSERPNRKPMPFHCKDCRQYFSVKTGTVMQGSNLSLSKWAIAFFLYSTNLKGVSSMKLHRDLGITQKSAWHMAHRIREAWTTETSKFTGPVEVDETYIGGKERNKHKSKKLNAGRGTVGKTAVVGIRDRDTGQVRTQVVASTDAGTLQGFVRQHTKADTMVYTDEAAASSAFPGLTRRSSTAFPSSSGGMAHTNGMESYWAGLKRGYDGVYHHMSPKHLNRYIDEFEGRHNSRPMDTADMMSAIAYRSQGKRLRYQDLVA